MSAYRILANHSFINNGMRSPIQRIPPVIEIEQIKEEPEMSVFDTVKK
jgi:hypothetical protein